MHNHNNGLKTALLLGSMIGFLLLIGAGLSAFTRSSVWILLFGVLGVGTVAYTYWNSDKIAIRSMNAYPVTREQIPGLYKIVEELSTKAGQPMPRLYVAPVMTPNAFATGRNPQNAAVCCTEGILQLLDEREMRGVIGHELMHVYNRDILTGSIAAAVASVIGTIANFASFGMMFGGGNSNENRGGGILFSLLIALFAPLAAGVMQMAISRTREYDADEDGARLTGDPLALASALHKLENGVSRYPMNPDNQRVAGAASMMIANPFRGEQLKNMMSTHPPMTERIARLENMARQNGQL